MRIKLLTFGFTNHGIPDALLNKVATEFHTDVSGYEGKLDISDFYDPVRRQYNGNDILKAVHEMYARADEKMIGLFQVDLFIPILTYIFGQAFLNGNSGIASLYRLKNERYGLPPDQPLLMDRFVKEIIHETGHMFGLLHCHDPLCVMRSSTYVEDIDQKSSFLCTSCSAKITVA